MSWWWAAAVPFGILAAGGAWTYIRWLLSKPRAPVPALKPYRPWLAECPACGSCCDYGVHHKPTWHEPRGVLVIECFHCKYEWTSPPHRKIAGDDAEFMAEGFRRYGLAFNDVISALHGRR